MVNKGKRAGPYVTLPDGLYAIEAPTYVAGFIVEHNHVTRCDPVLRRRLVSYWVWQARLVSPVVTFEGVGDGGIHDGSVGVLWMAWR